jgi:hypothetical protein
MMQLSSLLLSTAALSSVASHPEDKGTFKSASRKTAYLTKQVILTMMVEAKSMLPRYKPVTVR